MKIYNFNSPAYSKLLDEFLHGLSLRLDTIDYWFDLVMRKSTAAHSLDSAAKSSFWFWQLLAGVYKCCMDSWDLFPSIDIETQDKAGHLNLSKVAATPVPLATIG